VRNPPIKESKKMNVRKNWKQWKKDSEKRIKKRWM